MELKSKVALSPIVEKVCQTTDYAFTGEVITTVPDFEKPDDGFGIGLIVGPSGSGKSTILRQFYGESDSPLWDNNKAICDHFESYEQAHSRLSGAGLNSIPAWLKPHSVLSNGEKYRADLARNLTSGAGIDEFTSVVDRNVAISCSVAVRKHVKREGLQNVVLATCHYDVIDWLEPDWVFDCAVGEFTSRGSLRQPRLNITLEPCTAEAWAVFRPHHYLDGAHNRAARAWVAKIGTQPVGFVSALAFPSGAFKNAWRGHRTVVLPDFQGMGIGNAISEAIGEMFIKEGCRYFSKTAHPNFGKHRDDSPLWRPTSKNHKTRKDYRPDRGTKFRNKMKHAERMCYSHEYIGGQHGHSDL